MADIFNIAGEINSTSQEGTAVHANQVKDDLKNKKQSQINEEVGEELVLHTNRLNALTGQNYVTVVATQSTTVADIPTLINASGEGEQADTLYRVGFWDGSAYVADKYTEYAWNGTAYIILDVKSSISEVFDISLYKAVGGVLATFADLSAALDGGNNVPAGVRQGGMSIKFVQSSDKNYKYVQYRLMADAFTTDVTYWVSDEALAEKPISGEITNTWYSGTGIGDTLTTATQENKQAIIDVSGGEYFRVSVTGATQGRGWYIVDVNNVIIALATAGALTNDIIEVPVGVGASRVIIQSRTVSASQVWDVVQFGGVSSMQEYLKRTDSVPTKDSKHLVESGGVYPALNIYDANWNTPSGTYFTLATAIASVPNQFKRVGLLLSFRESSTKVSIYMYNSGNLDGFNDTSKWVSIEYKIPELGLLSANLRNVLGFNNFYFPGWVSNTLYKVGDYIKTDKDILRCNTEHTSGETIDTSKFTSRTILDYLFKDGGNYIINYNTLIGDGRAVTFTELTQSILLNIVATRRYPYAILMVRGTDNIYHYYQYKLSSTADIYWGDTTRWFALFESNKDYASIQSQIQAFTYLNTQTIPYTNHEYAYTTGNYNIGDTFDGSTTVNGVIDSWKIKVKKYDVISIKGYGAQGPRLWCTVDNDGKILAMADANYQASDYIDVKIRQDGYIYINARNNQPSYPYGVIHNTSLNFEYLAKAIEEIPEPTPAPAYSPSNWLAMGDSITQGWYSYKDETYPNGHGVNNPVKGWVYKMSKITGKSVTNRGIGGTGYVCQGTSESDINARQLIDSMSAADFADKQLVTLAYGINDYKKGDIVLGTMQDDVSVGGTVISNMRYVIEKIQQYNPLVKIIVITPFNAQGYYGQRLGDETTNYAIGYAKNGKTLQDYYEAFIEVCKYYGIQYIDATHTSLISRKAIPEQLPDGVHPSEDAHTMIAREMAERITIY